MRTQVGRPATKWEAPLDAARGIEWRFERADCCEGEWKQRMPEYLHKFRLQWGPYGIWTNFDPEGKPARKRESTTKKLGPGPRGPTLNRIYWGDQPKYGAAINLRMFLFSLSKWRSFDIEGRLWVEREALTSDVIGSDQPK